jgi:hypothetical protein
MTSANSAPYTLSEGFGVAMKLRDKKGPVPLPIPEDGISKRTQMTYSPGVSDLVSQAENVPYDVLDRGTRVEFAGVE